MKTLSGIVFMIGLGAFPVSGFAQSNVAVAYSTSTQDVGFAQDDTKSAASEKAMAACQQAGAKDCTIAAAGADMCVSLARATSKAALGIGAGPSRQASQDKAMSECALGGAEGCNIHDTYCAPADLE